MHHRLNLRRRLPGLLHAPRPPAPADRRLRRRTLLPPPVELQVDTLVEEAQQPADPGDLIERLAVAPDQIALQSPVVEPDRVIRRRPLVGAVRDRLAVLELPDHVLARQVPPR